MCGPLSQSVEFNKSFFWRILALRGLKKNGTEILRMKVPNDPFVSGKSHHLMKRALFSLPILIGTALLMIGADFRTSQEQAEVRVKKHCAGYTIIEAGLGVDCNGDTLQLIKRYGYYEVATRYEKNETALRAK
jgi:hypothetical protein